MAETRVAQSSTPDTVPAEPKKKSPLRTLILFGILLLVIGAYAHDYFIAAPAAAKADEEIHKLVGERNALGVKEGELVRSEDIQKLLGKQPSKVDEQKDYTVEVYRYWGGMLPQRQYISVLYLGDKEPRRYHVHYLNSMPEPDDLPSETKIPSPPATDDESGEEAGPGPEGVRSETEAPAETSSEQPGEDKSDEKSADEPAADSPAAESPAAETPAPESPAESAEEATDDDSK